MKVVIISSSDTGGAGIAALRLHRALLSCGVESSFLCLHKKEEGEQVYEFHKPFYAKVIEHLPIPYKQNKYKKFYSELSKVYGCFSFPEAIFDIADHPLVKEADIVNLHWVGNMLNYPSFFAKVKKPIVWTLHDRNAFWGIAHYGGDKLQNVQYQFLEDRIAQLKSQAIHQHNNLTIVNLSSWMLEQSSISDAFSRYQHVIIPNSIDTSTFRLYNQKLIRKKLNLPIDKPVFIFVSQHVSNYWKGFDILLDAMHHIHNECHYLVVGEKSDALQSNTNMTFLGTINDESLMAEAYSAADAFLLPTREDNFPNTMVESLCCGTPVITFTNGGMRDCIQTMKNGILVEQMDARHFADAINVFIQSSAVFNRKNISSEAIRQFNPAEQARKYLKVFNSLLKK